MSQYVTVPVFIVNFNTVRQEILAICAKNRDKGLLGSPAAIKVIW
jgi:hypothetical protein